MKKSVGLVFAIVVVGGVYAGAVVYSGNKVQQRLEAASAKMVETLPFIKVVDSRYEKGFLSATYSRGYQVGCAVGEEQKPFVVTVRDTIQHGPFPGFSSVGAARIDTQIVLPENAPESLRKFVATMKPQDIRTLVSLGGAATVDMSVPAGEWQHEGAKINWKPLRTTVHVDAQESNTRYEMSWPEVAIEDRSALSDTQVTVKFTNMRAQGSGSGLLMLASKGSAEVERVEMQVNPADPANGMTFTGDQWKVVSEVTRDNDLMNAQTNYNGNLVVKLAKDGREFKFDKFEMQESFKRLHVPTLQMIASGAMKEMSTCQPEQASPDEHMQALVASMVKLLPFNPEYSMDKLALEYAGARGEMSYSMAVSDVPAQYVESLDLGMSLLQNGTTKGAIKLPMAWFDLVAEARAAQAGATAGEEHAAAVAEAKQSMSQLLDSIVASGYVTREGDFVSSSFSLQKGQLLVNGKPFGGEN